MLNDLVKGVATRTKTPISLLQVQYWLDTTERELKTVYEVDPVGSPTGSHYI